MMLLKIRLHCFLVLTRASVVELYAAICSYAAAAAK